MIYTLTLNPSIDYHIWVAPFQEGQINRAQKEWKAAGGKGINVSKVLQILGMDSTVLGYVGGFTGEFIQQELEQTGVVHQLIPISGESRINVKIKAERETDISGVSPAIPAEAVEQLWAQLDRLQAGDYLVLAGSVPESLPSDIYQTIMNKLGPKGVHLVLDAKGKALRSGLSERPFLIKPNHHELGELFEVEIRTPQEAVAYGRKAVELGAQNVIVSLAEQGAVFVNRQETYIARIPTGKLVNSIGAGDSVVAGFLYAYNTGSVVKDAFSFAVAAGSATALSEGFCTPEKIAELLPQITIL
ncbi:1-phosphofructokinase [Brevibacillus fulvus]|uniref:Tagatose-6-phosphate kinase n=1 Tax=Brevibacillus fulvus TaxID=1125967 RepID=A0A938XYQ6_9BACL|nr:1-phosphofructokinase [Brevibacillus fulvus]MBM7590276.1 1-phosphofructokinase [Brevibacillus fulvus]